MNSPESTIRSRIARCGKITFAEFMEHALYHPQGGYYTDPSGSAVSIDYYTSPGAHPAFGALLATQFHLMWDALQRPRQFLVIEMGADTGLLAQDVVRYATTMSSSFAQSLRYVTLERHNFAEHHANQPLGIERVITSVLPLKGIVGCIFSNELVDSFPVHCFQIRCGVPEEVYVVVDERGCVSETLSTPSTPLLARRIDELGFPLDEGFRGEVNLAIKSWLRGVSTALVKGFVLTIDYGYEAYELYSPERSQGTLQTYYRHRRSANPYRRIGKQDITAHVDFSLISDEGESLGLRSLGLVSQSHYLNMLGLRGMVSKLRDEVLSQRAHDANRMAMLDLVKPEGLGRFKVLIQERGTEVKDIARLIDGDLILTDGRTPLMGSEHIPLMEGRYPHLAWEPQHPWLIGGDDGPVTSAT